MVETKKKQRQAKKNLDEKLKFSTPDAKLLETLAVECAAKPSSDNTFQYAFALSRSAGNEAELKYACTILDGLVKEGYDHEVDCMHGAATALYLLRDYDGARARCEAILRSNPDSRNAAEMHLACIEAAEEERERKVKKAAVEGTLGMAAVGLAVGVAGLLLKRR
jgi:fission 1 protein